MAPCGMNCAVCSGYLAMNFDLNSKGMGKRYCAGCLPRGKNCAFLKKRCDLLGNGKLRFCYECPDFPCLRLQTLDKRYRTNYRMSVIDNLKFIRENGLKQFLEKERQKWRCPDCGGTICCHNVICYNCGLDKLNVKKTRYRWED